MKEKTMNRKIMMMRMKEIRKNYENDGKIEEENEECEREKSVTLNPSVVKVGHKIRSPHILLTN